MGAKPCARCGHLFLVSPLSSHHEICKYCYKEMAKIFKTGNPKAILKAVEQHVRHGKLLDELLKD